MPGALASGFSMIVERPMDERAPLERLRVPKPMAGAYATSRACNSFFRRRSELKEVFRSIFSSSRTYNSQPAAAGLAKGKPKKPKKADVLLLQQAQQHPQQAQHPQFMGVPLS